MRVYAINRMERQQLDVYVELAPGLYATPAEGGRTTDTVRVEQGTEAPRWMAVDYDLAGLLAKALVETDARIDQPATVDHLADAIGVRDRLLTMVEKFVEATSP